MRPSAPAPAPQQQQESSSVEAYLAGKVADSAADVGAAAGRHAADQMMQDQFGFGGPGQPPM
jgi:hypothetical protein